MERSCDVVVGCWVWYMCYLQSSGIPSSLTSYGFIAKQNMYLVKTAHLRFSIFLSRERSGIRTRAFLTEKISQRLGIAR